MFVPLAWDTTEVEAYDRKEHWSDIFHHKPALKQKEAQWVTNAVLGALKKL